MCPNLSFLSLAENAIEEWFDIRYLGKLNFLDLSQNKLKDNGADKLPKSLIILSLQENPLTRESDNQFAYRKPYVLELPELEEMDSVNVIAAERLSYQGLLPKVNIYKMLNEMETKKAQEQANWQLEVELSREIKMEGGKTQREIMDENLDDYAKLDEFAEMDDIVSGMLERHEGAKKEQDSETKARKEKIQQRVDKVSQKYGRIMTPASQAGRSKAANLEPENF